MFKPGSAGQGCGACGAAARIRGERRRQLQGEDGQTIAACAARRGRSSIVGGVRGDRNRALQSTAFRWVRERRSSAPVRSTATGTPPSAGRVAGRSRDPELSDFTFRRSLLPTSRARGWQAYPRPVRVEPLRPTGPGASLPRTDPHLRPRSRRPPARRHVSVGRRRTHPVGCTPVTRKARQRKRSEGRHANVGQDGKPLVADDPAEMRRPVARRLADAAVPRLPTPAWA